MGRTVANSVSKSVLDELGQRQKVSLRDLSDRATYLDLGSDGNSSENEGDNENCLHWFR